MKRLSVWLALLLAPVLGPVPPAPAQVLAQVPVQLDRLQRADGAQVVPDRFLRRWDPVTVLFAADTGPGAGRAGGRAGASGDAVAGQAGRLAMARAAHAAIPPDRALGAAAARCRHPRRQRPRRWCRCCRCRCRPRPPTCRTASADLDTIALTFDAAGGSSRAGAAADHRAAAAAAAPRAAGRRAAAAGADRAGFRHPPGGAQRARRPADLPGRAAPAGAGRAGRHAAAAPVRRAGPGRSDLPAAAAQRRAVHADRSVLRRRLHPCAAGRRDAVQPRSGQRAQGRGGSPCNSPRPRRRWTSCGRATRCASPRRSTSWPSASAATASCASTASSRPTRSTASPSPPARCTTRAAGRSPPPWRRGFRFAPGTPSLGWDAPQGIVERLGPQMVPLRGHGYDQADLRIYPIDPLGRDFWPFPRAGLVTSDDRAPPLPGNEPPPYVEAGPISGDDMALRILALGSPSVSRTGGSADPARRGGRQVRHRRRAAAGPHRRGRAARHLSAGAAAGGRRVAPMGARAGHRPVAEHGGGGRPCALRRHLAGDRAAGGGRRNPAGRRARRARS